MRQIGIWLIPLGLCLSAPGFAQAPNSGLPGSTCEPVDLTAPAEMFPLDAGVSTTVLDSYAPPAYYEWGLPTVEGGTPATARRLIMIMHGGGWYQTGLQHVIFERAGADFLRARGW